MMTTVKYELKKIFQNRIFIAVFVLAFAAVTAFTLHSLNMYAKGNVAGPSLTDMNGEKMPAVFVSKENIDELRAELEAFENNDDIYLYNWRDDPKFAGKTLYFGKYDVKISELFRKLDKGEITEAEYDGIISAHKDDPIIKQEYLPAYFKLSYPVQRYENEVLNTELSKERGVSEEDSPREYRRALEFEKKAKRLVENGFTVGYDYGWANTLNSFSQDTGIFLAVVVIFGLCNVFTGEYAGGVDALLLSSKRGRAKLVGAKLIASAAYVFICTLVYTLTTLLVNLAFLGFEGANVTNTLYGISNAEIFLNDCLTMLAGALLLGMTTLAVSAAFSKQTASIAASVLIGASPFFIANFIYAPDSVLLQITEALPINMIFGSYLSTVIYAFINNRLFDIRLLFIPVAIITAAVCLPLIYVLYCKHQVKN